MVHTSQKESGAVGAKLSPEAGEEVDELEGWDTLLAHQGGVHSSSNVEQGHDLQPTECHHKAMANHCSWALWTAIGS